MRGRYKDSVSISRRRLIVGATAATATAQLVTEAGQKGLSRFGTDVFNAGT